jgi:hypothetical protein
MVQGVLPGIGAKGTTTPAQGAPGWTIKPTKRAKRPVVKERKEIREPDKIIVCSCLISLTPGTQAMGNLPFEQEHEWSEIYISIQIF